MKKLFTIIIIALFSIGVYAQQMSPVEWIYKTKKIKSGEYELNILAMIATPWHLYGQYFDDGGPIKLKFVFTENENYKLIDSVKETPKPKIVKDEIFDIDVHYFENKALFTQKVKITHSTEVIVMIEGQVCDDNTGMCVMVYDEHIFLLK